MEFSASNIGRDAFDVNLNVVEDNVEESIFQFCMGLTRVSIEFITNFAPNKKQAKSLHRVINKMCKKLTDDFLDGPYFNEIKNATEEKNLYRFMETVFEDALHECKLSREEFLELFADSKTLRLEPSKSENEIVIKLSNGVACIPIRKFKTEIAEKQYEFEKEVDLAIIVATVAGDILIGEYTNPIRENYSPQDTHLIDEIQKLI